MPPNVPFVLHFIFQELPDFRFDLPAQIRRQIRGRKLGAPYEMCEKVPIDSTRRGNLSGSFQFLHLFFQEPTSTSRDKAQRCCLRGKSLVSVILPEK